MIWTFSFGMAGSTGGQAQEPASPTDERPNIILLMVDDMRADELALLPRIQSLLVAQGLSFDRFFSPNALCCPARTSILRGQFSHNHGIWTNFAGLGGGFLTAYKQGLETETLPVWLERGGYDTSLMGKYLNGYGKANGGFPDRTYVPPGWTDWFGLLEPPDRGSGDGYYDGYTYEANDNGTVRAFGNTAADYSTDVLSRQAATFIRRRVDRPVRKPFFLYLAPTAPHRPIMPAQRHATHMFSAYEPPLEANFNESDVSDKPAWIQALPRFNENGRATLVQQSRDRLGSLLAVEDMLEELLGALDAAGELHRTHVLFISDNGFHRGEHRLRSKATTYDEAVRVPLVVRGPGVAPGQAIQHFTYNHDLAPTILALAGVTAPLMLDGQSLLPLLDETTRPTQAQWRRSILLEHREHNNKGRSQPENASIRTGGYQYIEYVDPAERCELYDIGAHADPLRLQNRCNDPAMAKVQGRLATRLRELRACVGVECQEVERRPVP